VFKSIQLLRISVPTKLSKFEILHSHGGEEVDCTLEIQH
jgi:hypothetical protein